MVNGMSLIKEEKKRLIRLIDEHKSVSNEIHKLNLMFRR